MAKLFYKTADTFTVGVKNVEFFFFFFYNNVGIFGVHIFQSATKCTATSFDLLEIF